MCRVDHEGLFTEEHYGKYKKKVEKKLSMLGKSIKRSYRALLNNYSRNFSLSFPMNDRSLAKVTICKATNSLAKIPIQFGHKCFSTKEVSNSCPGCGAQFQKNQPTRHGFLPEIKDKTQPTSEQIQSLIAQKEPITKAEAKLLMNANKRLICQRCHSLKSGVQRTTSLKTNIIQFSNLKATTGGLVILILDLLDLHNTFISNLTQYVGQKEFIVLLNKQDLMPEKYNAKKITRFVKSQPFAENALDIIQVSSKTGKGMELVMKHIEDRFIKNEDCYMVGCTSVGKSTLLNYLKKLAGDNILVSTSRTSGTTHSLIQMSSSKLLPMISTHLDDIEKKKSIDPRRSSEIVSKGENFLYDTAGIVHDSQLYNLFDDKELSFVFPKSRMVLKKHEMKPNYSLFIGGFVRIDVASDSPECEIWFYGSASLRSHRCRAMRVPRLMERIGCEDTDFFPPLKNRSRPFPEMKKVQKFIHDSNQESTYFISGVGWFTIKGSCFFEVFSPDGKGISELKGTIMDGNIFTSTPKKDRVFKPTKISKARKAAMRVKKAAK
jgi:ribosome biogenesis GTPase A/RNase P subunit RPR2